MSASGPKDQPISDLLAAICEKIASHANEDWIEPFKAEHPQLQDPEFISNTLIPELKASSIFQQLRSCINKDLYKQASIPTFCQDSLLWTVILKHFCVKPKINQDYIEFVTRAVFETANCQRSIIEYFHTCSLENRYTYHDWVENYLQLCDHLDTFLEKFESILAKKSIPCQNLGVHTSACLSTFLLPQVCRYWLSCFLGNENKAHYDAILEKKAHLIKNKVLQNFANKHHKKIGLEAELDKAISRVQDFSRQNLTCYEAELKLKDYLKTNVCSQVMPGARHPLLQLKDSHDIDRIDKSLFQDTAKTLEDNLARDLSLITNCTDNANSATKVQVQTIKHLDILLGLFEVVLAHPEDYQSFEKRQVYDLFDRWVETYTSSSAFMKKFISETVAPFKRTMMDALIHKPGPELGDTELVATMLDAPTWASRMNVCSILQRDYKQKLSNADFKDKLLEKLIEVSESYLATEEKLLTIEPHLKMAQRTTFMAQLLATDLNPLKRCGFALMMIGSLNKLFKAYRHSSLSVNFESDAPIADRHLHHIIENLERTSYKPFLDWQTQLDLCLKLLLETIKDENGKWTSDNIKNNAKSVTKLIYCFKELEIAYAVFTKDAPKKYLSKRAYCLAVVDGLIGILQGLGATQPAEIAEAIERAQDHLKQRNANFSFAKAEMFASKVTVSQEDQTMIGFLKDVVGQVIPGTNPQSEIDERYKAMANTVEQNNKTIENLKATNNHQKLKIKRQTAELATLGQKLEERNKQITSLKQTIAEAARTHKQSIEPLQSELEETTAQVKALQATLKAKDQAHRQACSEWEQARNALHAQIEHFEQGTTYQALRSENEVLASRVTQQEASAQRTQIELNQQADKLANAYAELDQKDEIIESLTQQVEALQLEVTSKDKTIEKSSKALKKAATDYQVKQKDVDVLTSELSRLSLTQGDTLKALEDATKRSSALSQRNLELTAELETKSAALAKLNEKLASSEQTLESYRQIASTPITPTPATRSIEQTCKLSPSKQKIKLLAEEALYKSRRQVEVPLPIKEVLSPIMAALNAVSPDNSEKDLADGDYHRTYIDGGVLRDLVAGRPDILERSGKDYDLITTVPASWILGQDGKIAGKFFSQNPFVPHLFTHHCPHHPIDIVCHPNLSLLEEANKRDVSASALFMNEKFELIDPLNAVAEIDKKMLNLIGDPAQCLDEDPSRALRLIRLACEYQWNAPLAEYGRHLQVYCSKLTNVPYGVFSRHIKALFDTNGGFAAVFNMGLLEVIFGTYHLQSKLQSFPWMQEFWQSAINQPETVIDERHHYIHYPALCLTVEALAQQDIQTPEQIANSFIAKWSDDKFGQDPITERSQKQAELSNYLNHYIDCYRQYSETTSQYIQAQQYQQPPTPKPKLQLTPMSQHSRQSLRQGHTQQPLTPSYSNFPPLTQANSGAPQLRNSQWPRGRQPAKGNPTPKRLGHR